MWNKLESAKTDHFKIDISDEDRQILPIRLRELIQNCFTRAGPAEELRQRELSPQCSVSKIRFFKIKK